MAEMTGWRKDVGLAVSQSEDTSEWSTVVEGMKVVPQFVKDRAARSVGRLGSRPYKTSGRIVVAGFQPAFMVSPRLRA